MPDILTAFSGVKKSGAGWTAKCPAHEDRRASLSIGHGDDDRWLLKCHAGCDVDAILAAAHLETRDLFPKRGTRQRALIVATYDYTDEHGTALYQVVRFEPKDFRQRRRNGRGDWDWSVKGVRRVVYRLHTLQGQKTVFIVEGEKDVNRLAELGLTATANVGGASKSTDPTKSKWRDAYTEQLTAAGIQRAIVIPDADEPGMTHARAVAASCHAAGIKTKLLTLPVPPKGDVTDYLADHGKDDLFRLVKDAPRCEPSQVDSPHPDDRSEREPGAGPPDVETVLARCDLAEIPTPPSPANIAKIEQGLRRLQTVLKAADPLRIAAVRGALVVKCQAAKVPSPAALIDSALASLKQAATEQNTNGLELFPIDEPWPDPVDGVELMGEIRDLLRQYLVLPPHVDVVLPLWAQHTYSMDCWDISPFLTTTSPAPECGKTTLAAIVGGVSHHTVNSSNATPAAIFRLIDKYGPTLILDEADTWLGLRDELRGILNSGHKRSGARVIRADGENNEPKVFSTWAPKLIAMIGTPLPTISSRSILVPMRRKTEKERRPRLKDRVLHVTCQRLRRKCLRWAMDHRQRLLTAEPAISELLENRTGDNWLPLFATADEIGEPWATDVRTAAKTLSSVSQDQAHGIVLLADVKSIWERDENRQEDFLKTSVILESLHEMEARPWGAWGRQEKPMTPQVLAGLLKQYDPKPLDKRVGGKVNKGYIRSDFEDAWLRYLPASPDPAATSQQVNKNGGKPENPVRNTPPDVADAQVDVSAINTGENAECCGVADRKPDSGEENEKLRSDEGVAVENQGEARFRDF